MMQVMKMKCNSAMISKLSMTGNVPWIKTATKPSAR